MKFLPHFLCILFFPLIAKGQTRELYIGTYTQNHKSQGIYTFSFDMKTGIARPLDTLITPNPSFLSLSADKNNLFAVNELSGGEGSVIAFTRTKKKDFVFVNQMLTLGDSPCHITTDPRGRFLIVSNYSGGNLSVFKITGEGELNARIQLFDFEGRGPDSIRQNSPHIHSASFSPDGRFLLVQDLGTDQIYIFSFDPKNDDAPLARIGATRTSPGGGPRHAVFSSDGRRVYLIEEMGSRVSVFKFESGILSFIEQKSLLSTDFQGKTGAADIHISPDGRFLYASNRGDANDITIFKIKENGRLKYLERQSVLGKGPRNFAISPDGQYLLVANQYTNEIKVFTRNQKTGTLIYSGHDIIVDSPVCLKF